MILIADSGATKTDWYAGDNPENGQLIETKGINPFHLKEEEVFRIIREQLVAQLANADTCTAVYFYGAGCIPEKQASSAAHWNTFSQERTYIFTQTYWVRLVPYVENSRG